MIFKSNRTTRIRVAALIIESEKILLIAHKKDGKVYWLLPGGGVRYGESLHQALGRELLEELNIGVNIHEIILICDSVAPDGDRHIINICFNCSYSEGDYAIGDDEILHNFGFFGIDELKDLQVFPPIKNELLDILTNKHKEIYVGARWMKM